jgi:hypothetical protein
MVLSLLWCRPPGLRVIPRNASAMTAVCPCFDPTLVDEGGDLHKRLNQFRTANLEVLVVVDSKREHLTAWNRERPHTVLVIEIGEAVNPRIHAPAVEVGEAEQPSELVLERIPIGDAP